MRVCKSGHAFLIFLHCLCASKVSVERMSNAKSSNLLSCSPPTNSDIQPDTGSDSNSSRLPNTQSAAGRMLYRQTDESYTFKSAFQLQLVASLCFHHCVIS